MHSNVQEYFKIPKKKKNVNRKSVEIHKRKVTIIESDSDRSYFMQAARQRYKTGEKWAEPNNIYR